MAILFLGSIPGAYFNAVMVCFFVNLFRTHGLVFNPVTAVRLTWPVCKAMLLGFVPAALLGAAIQLFMPSWSGASLLITPLGVLVSAVLLHRMFLAEISKRRNWNVSILILTVIQIGVVGLLLVQLHDSL